MNFKEEIARAEERLRKAYAALKRVNALSEMSQKDNPYRPLIRVMCKLDLIKGWPIY